MTDLRDSTCQIVYRPGSIRGVSLNNFVYQATALVRNCACVKQMMSFYISKEETLKSNVRIEGMMNKKNGTRTSSTKKE